MKDYTYIVHSDVDENNLYAEFGDSVEAIEYAKEHKEDKTWVVEIEVEKNDFGEVIWSGNQETVWSYQDEVEHEPQEVTKKDVAELDADFERLKDDTEESPADWIDDKKLMADHHTKIKEDSDPVLDPEHTTAPIKDVVKKNLKDLKTMIDPEMTDLQPEKIKSTILAEDSDPVLNAEHTTAPAKDVANKNLKDLKATTDPKMTDLQPEAIKDDVLEEAKKDKEIVTLDVRKLFDTFGTHLKFATIEEREGQYLLFNSKDELACVDKEHCKIESKGKNKVILSSDELEDPLPWVKEFFVKFSLSKDEFDVAADNKAHDTAKDTALKEAQEKKTIRISLRKLFKTFGEKLKFATIEHVVGGYYNLYNEAGDFACMDAENCSIESKDNDKVVLVNEDIADPEAVVKFTLSKEEFDIAAYDYDTPNVDTIREEMEKNEADVECQVCYGIFPKNECVYHEDKHGYVCKDCGNNLYIDVVADKTKGPLNEDSELDEAARMDEVTELPVQCNKCKNIFTVYNYNHVVSCPKCGMTGWLTVEGDETRPSRDEIQMITDYFNEHPEDRKLTVKEELGVKIKTLEELDEGSDQEQIKTEMATLQKELDDLEKADNQKRGQGMSPKNIIAEETEMDKEDEAEVAEPEESEEVEAKEPESEAEEAETKIEVPEWPEVEAEAEEDEKPTVEEVLEKQETAEEKLDEVEDNGETKEAVKSWVDSLFDFFEVDPAELEKPVEEEASIEEPEESEEPDEVEEVEDDFLSEGEEKAKMPVERVDIEDVKNDSAMAQIDPFDLDWD